MKLNILFEDNQIIVVEKPQNLLSQSDITGDSDLLSIVKEYIKEKYKKPGNVYIGLVHRLDRPVGGLMLFARSSKAASRLSLEFREHTFKKSYLAVVHSGSNNLGYKNLTGQIYKSKENNFSSMEESKDLSKSVELNLEELEFKDNLTLVKIYLKTGRSHQIRVQLSDLGTPIYGDMKYGRMEKGKIALWSYQIEFIHPTLKNKMSFSLQPPIIFPWTLFPFLNK